jgi:hypothetical protein
LIGKHKVLERSLESPLIIRPPASLSPEVFAGIPAEGVVETIDIYPTIAELCGLTPPASAAGSSLVPMLRNPFAPGKDHAFSRFGSLTTIRTLDWRLINTSGNYDLYDLSSVRYELEDVSASNPSVVGSLSVDLAVQGTRSGTTYAAWAAGDPLLVDPAGDGDNDGSSNALEYAAGSGGLDSTSRPEHGLSFEDLTGHGFSDHELVYRFNVAIDADDSTLWPSSSTGLDTWAFEALEFFDATPAGLSTMNLGFRVSDVSSARRFFRTATSGE